MDYLLILLYWSLWPRHSLILPVLMALAAGVLFLSGRRRVAAALAGSAALCASWYFWVRFVPKSLAVESVRSITVVSATSGDVGVITDPRDIERITSYFRRVRVRPAVSMCDLALKVTFHVARSSVTYRVQVSGNILEDVPSSAIQDVYVPSRGGLYELLAGHVRCDQTQNADTK